MKNGVPFPRVIFPLVMACFYFLSFPLFASVVYVNKNAAGLNNGSSWTDAFTNLQSGLSAAVSNDEIWVAAGTYVPGTNRTDTFQLKQWGGLYGGFNGAETNRNQRDWTNNITILSGDVLGDDMGFSNNVENVYHVVCGADNATIDGFVVQGGNGASEGGGMYNYVVSPTVKNCVFSRNSAGNGGGMYNYDSSSIVQNCIFFENSGFNCGGMLNYTSVSITVSRCIFVGNTAPNCGGLFNWYSSSTVENCVFSGNGGSHCGGMRNMNSTSTVQNCIFTGNYNELSGSGMRNDWSSYFVQNCIFAGNSTYVIFGGGMYSDLSSSGVVVNCTFSGNFAGTYGGGVSCFGESLCSLINCIMWPNSASSEGSEVYSGWGSTTAVSFCDIRGGVNGTETYSDSGSTNVDAGGNINADPVFAVGATGTWSQNATYNGRFQTILTDNTAAWAINELAGKFVQPDMNNVLQYLIVSNSATYLAIWGDFSTNEFSGKTYQIYDYHLKSQAGHWESGLGTWTNDTLSSPCIDAGDPASTWTNEPAPNGSRINMGAYGNTPEASKTPLKVNNIGASNITSTSATLFGNLVSDGGTTTFVRVYWGPSDGETNSAAWTNVVNTGALPVGLFSTNIYSLQSGTLYYYRCFASNDFGTVWAPNSTNFTTLKRNQTITFQNPGDQWRWDRLILVAHASSGLPVKFVVLSGPAVISGKTNLSFTGVGVVTIAARQSGNANWNAAPQVTVTFNVANKSRNDISGDGKADLVVYDKLKGKWFVMTVDGQSILWNFAWGGINMIPLPGDYDGDQIDDLCVFNPTDGRWYIWSINNGIILWGKQWGGAAGQTATADKWYGSGVGMTPVIGDYNGDGIFDLVVYDEPTGKWYGLGVNNQLLFWGHSWGGAGMHPVSGDFNGDGAWDFAIFNDSIGKWYIQAHNGALIAWDVAWGANGMTTVPGDYDGDGKYDLALYEQTTGKWYIRTLAGKTLAWGFAWGGGVAIAVPGDYDGDGAADLVVYNEATGKWYGWSLKKGVLFWAKAWGGAGLVPVVW